MRYQVIIPKPVQKQLDELPSHPRKHILKKVLSFKQEPRPRGCIKLRKYENEYRVRIGDYRVRYEINDQERIVLLLNVKHRKNAYRG